MRLGCIRVRYNTVYQMHKLCSMEHVQNFFASSYVCSTEPSAMQRYIAIYPIEYIFGHIHQCNAHHTTPYILAIT